jgi:flagellar basal body rod protein FlgG
MSSVSSISLSGMNAARTALSASAFNIANLGADGFRRQQVELTSVAPAGVSATLGQAAVPGDAMVTDLLDMLQANSAFLANLAVFKTSANMAGTLLNTIG